MKKILLCATVFLAAMFGANGQSWKVGPRVGYSMIGYSCGDYSGKGNDALTVALSAVYDEMLVVEGQYITASARDEDSNMSFIGLYGGFKNYAPLATGNFNLFYGAGLNFDFLTSATYGTTSISEGYNKFILGMSCAVGIELGSFGFQIDLKTSAFTNIMKKDWRINPDVGDKLFNAGMSIYYLF